MAAVALLAIVGAAGFRATPGVLIDPLHEAFGWSRATISAAVSVNMLLFGLGAPFAAALMDRFGIRRVVTVALLLVSAGSGLTVWMNASWQLLLCWGLLIGVGTGSLMALTATISSRWFVRKRGLVTGILTAGGATGQLIFLPLLANLVQAYGWRAASYVTAVAALLVVPLVIAVLRNHPREVGLLPYGAEPANGTPDGDTPASDAPADTSEAPRGSGAVGVLAQAIRRRPFWLLAGGFAICGASTNGLIQVHFVPAAHGHGMPTTTAAGLLAVIGVVDIVGTIASGWLTDRYSPRVLLMIYYAGRGCSLLLLPHLLSDTLHPSLLVFVLFYGLDWVATVPPTVVLCRGYFGERGPVVYGWVFASHQVGAAIAATGAGLVRDTLGSYTVAFTAAGLLCFLAAAFSASLRNVDRSDPTNQRQTAGTEQAPEATGQHDHEVATGQLMDDGRG